MTRKPISRTKLEMLPTRHIVRPLAVMVRLDILAGYRDNWFGTTVDPGIDQELPTSNWEFIMPTFTVEQRLLLEQAGDDPVRVADPEMGAEYVILKAELYDRIREVEEVRSAYLSAMKVFGRDGWDDPEIDEYNALGPSR